MPSKQKLAKTFRESISPGDYSNYSALLNNRMAELEKEYGNTPYWNQFKSIAALQMPSYFSPDRVDSDNYGFWTDMFSQYESTALSDINQLLGVIREEKYNSANQQVLRERLAGFNPDLSGDISAGEASEFDDSASKMPFPSAVAAESQRTAQITSIGQTALNFAQSFVGLASQFQGLRTGSLQNAGLELGLEGDVNDYVQELLSSSMPSKNESGDFVDDSGNSLSDDDVWKLVIDTAAKKVDYSPYGRRMRKLLQRGFNRYNDSSIGVMERFEKLANDFASSRFNRMKTQSSPLWDDDAGRMLSKVVDGFGSLDYDVWELKQKVQKSLYELNLRFQESQSDLGTPEKQAALEFQTVDNELQYQQALDSSGAPVKKGYNESLFEDVRKLSLDIEKKRQEAIDMAETEFAKIYNSLKGDKWYHVLGRILIPIARSLVTNGINAYFTSAASSLGHYMGSSRPAPVVNSEKNFYNNGSTYNYN